MPLTMPRNSFVFFGFVFVLFFNAQITFLIRFRAVFFVREFPG
jgi:hypothetical protein